METKKQANVKEHRSRPIFTVVAFAAVFALSTLVSYRYFEGARKADIKMGDPDVKVVENTTGSRGAPVFNPVTFGSVSIETEKETTAAGKIVNLKIKASSENRDVVGYDLILKYDTESFSLISKRSLLPNFDIYSFANDDGVTVTGLKKLNDSSVTVLDSEPIVEFRFLTYEEGDYTFAVSPSRNKEKTQMVDVNTDVFYPAIGDVTVTIE